MRRSAFLAATAATGCAARPAPAAKRSDSGAGAPARIVVLGDSIAVGTGASSPENGFVFRAYLRVRERYPGSRIDDLAIGGATAADVLRLQLPRLAYERDATVAVVCVGGNDVVRRTDPAAFAATYARLLERVRAALPRAAVVLCGVPDVGLSPLFSGGDAVTAARLSRAYDDTVRALAQRDGAALADLYDATRAHRADITRLLADDRFHPSDAGHAVFADVLAPVLLRAAGH